MKQVLIDWTTKQIEHGAEGKVLGLLTNLREIAEKEGLEGVKSYLHMEAMFNSMTGEQFDAGVAVGLLGGVEWLEALEAERSAGVTPTAVTVEAVA